MGGLPEIFDCHHRNPDDKKSNPYQHKSDSLGRAAAQTIRMEAEVVKKKRSNEPLAPPQAGHGERHPLFGALKGVTSIPPGVDLTEPADPDWADISEQDSVPLARR